MGEFPLGWETLLWKMTRCFKILSSSAKDFLEELRVENISTEREEKWSSSQTNKHWEKIQTNAANKESTFYKDGGRQILGRCCKGQQFWEIEGGTNFWIITRQFLIKTLSLDSCLKLLVAVVITLLAKLRYIEKTVNTIATFIRCYISFKPKVVT